MRRMADQELLVKLVQDGVTEIDLDEVGRALNGTGIHYELDEGSLILMPPMKAWHSDVAMRVCNVLRAQGRHAYQEQGVRLGSRRVRYPDVGAFRRDPDPESERHDPEDFLLAVEVISESSEHVDRVVKAGLYASAGIPEYWIVDRHPSDRRDAMIEFFRLGPSGGYERTGESALSELEEKYGIQRR
jgi:Uma2 family endonuclease